MIDVISILTALALLAVSIHIFLWHLIRAVHAEDLSTSANDFSVHPFAAGTVRLAAPSLTADQHGCQSLRRQHRVQQGNAVPWCGFPSVHNEIATRHVRSGPSRDNCSLQDVPLVPSTAARATTSPRLGLSHAVLVSRRPEAVACPARRWRSKSELYVTSSPSPNRCQPRRRRWVADTACECSGHNFSSASSDLGCCLLTPPPGPAQLGNTLAVRICFKVVPATITDDRSSARMARAH